MDLQPAVGLTPESQYPTNLDYTCQYCGKTYHGDQRLFFVRHLNECEQRCTDHEQKKAESDWWVCT